MTDINYKFEVGKEYETRGGYVATILDAHFNGRGAYTIAGKIKKRGFEELILWESDGTFFDKAQSHLYDLMPPVETKELWVNVYSGYTLTSSRRRTQKAQARTYVS